MPKCYICPSEKFVDDHHYDCLEGKLSPETVPLCRRCHRTYHGLGVEWFDDEYIDKAIEIENKRREIHNANLEYLEKERVAKAAQFPWKAIFKKPVEPLALLSREDIKRTDYFNKTHGIKKPAQNKGRLTPAFTFRLPHGEPLCGWDWVNEHMYDLMDWVPKIEIVSPDFKMSVTIDNAKKQKEVIKTLKGLKRSRE